MRAGHLYAEHVRLNRGGYDSRGKYWGVGPKLYRVGDADGVLDEYVRAPSAKVARERAREQHEKRERVTRHLHDR